jgi:hypothetical protein
MQQEDSWLQGVSEYEVRCVGALCWCTVVHYCVSAPCGRVRGGGPSAPHPVQPVVLPQHPSPEYRHPCYRTLRPQIGLTAKAAAAKASSEQAKEQEEEEAAEIDVVQVPAPLACTR